jgi:hypothetical protein
VAVNNTPQSATGTISNGSWSISSVTVNSGQVVTVWVDGGATTSRAVAVTKYDGNGNIEGMLLYERHLSIGSNDNQTITDNDLSQYDNSVSGDPDIFHDVSGTTLTVDINNYFDDEELYIKASNTLAPAGNVNTHHIEIKGTFTAAGTEVHTVNGNWVSSGSFTAASSTVKFTTTSAASITPNGQNFYNLIFDGSGGQWTPQDTMTADGNLTMTAGTLTGSQNITVNGGNATGTSNGTITLTGGTFTLAGTGSFGVDTTLWTFNNLTFGSGSSGTTSKTGSGDIEVNGVLTITASQTLQASSQIWELTSSSTPFVVSGTFLAQESLFKYTSATSTIISTTTYYKLELSPSAAGSPIYTIQSGTLTTNDYLYIGDSSNAVTVTASTNNPTLDIIGDFEIQSSATFTASGSGGFSVGGSWSNAGTFTHSDGTVVLDASSIGKTVDPGSSSFYKVDFNNASGGWTIIANATSTNDWKITTSTSFAATSSITIEVQGNYNIATSTPFITDWQPGSTLYLNGTSQTVGNKSQAVEKYANLDIGGDADIRMWNSYAATTTIVSTGSLYSMDYDEAGDGTADDGKLFIWGGYHTQAYDYWSYAKDFDEAGVTRQCQVTINSGASITIDNGESLEIKGGGSTSSDITIINASALWNLNNNGTTTIQEATINYLNPATGTITVLNTTLNNESTPGAGATLNVDWYLGAHVVDANSTSTNVANATTTISSTSTSDSTIWKWSGSGWGDASTTQTTLTNATGTIPQPGTDGAIRIREYKKTGTSTEWLSGWDQRIKFTIDNTKIDDDLSYFPVTVFLTSTQGEEVFTEFDADSDYLKVAFTKNDGVTELYAEKELIDDLEQQRIYHISKTGWGISSSTATDFYMYYDNDHADNTTYIGAINTTAGANVWDSNFKMVQHMKDETTATTSDSTSNNNDGTKLLANEPIETDAKIAKGQDFDGEDDGIFIGDEPSLDCTQVTLEAWIKADTLDTGEFLNIVVGKWKITDDQRSYCLNPDGTKLRFGISPDGFYASRKSLQTTGAISAETIYYITGTYDGSILRAYINGSPDATTVSYSGTIHPGSAQAQLGRIDYDGAPGYFDGIIDEVRISDIARAAAWIKAVYNSGNDSLLTYGSEESSTITYYKYNLAITANGFSNYDYNGLENRHYITSVSSTESTSTVDKCISENWQRDDIDANNTEQSLNEPPTTGTWYAGMSSDLEFGVNSFSVIIGPLNNSNNLTATATTITYVTTTAGYLIQAYASDNGELTATSGPFIPRWLHDNATPTAWGIFCKDNENYCGFGYTTSDDNLTGDNRFGSATKYAGFTSSTEPVADRPSDGTWWQGEQDTITYKVSVPETQAVETYDTTITYVCTAQY